MRGKLTRLLIGLQALLLLGNGTPQEKPDDIVFVLARPMASVKDLGPDTESDNARFQVRMETVKVLTGEFRKRYFDAPIIRHQRAFIFATREYVVALKLSGKAYKVMAVANAEMAFCFDEEATTKLDIDDRMKGNAYEAVHDPGNRHCWHVEM